MLRTLSEIAQEIRRVWIKPNYAAVPYLTALLSLHSIDNNYCFDSGLSVVLGFLCNAQGFRGDIAKGLKAELKAHVRASGYRIR